MVLALCASVLALCVISNVNQSPLALPGGQVFLIAQYFKQSAARTCQSGGPQSRGCAIGWFDREAKTETVHVVGFALGVADRFAQVCYRQAGQPSDPGARPHQMRRHCRRNPNAPRKRWEQIALVLLYEGASGHVVIFLVCFPTDTLVF